MTNMDSEKIVENCFEKSIKKGFFIHSDGQANEHWIDLEILNSNFFSQKKAVKECLKSKLEKIIQNYKIDLIIFTTNYRSHYSEFRLYSIEGIIREIVDDLNRKNKIKKKINYSYIKKVADDTFTLDEPDEAVGRKALAIIGFSKHEGIINDLTNVEQNCKLKIEYKFFIIGLKNTNQNNNKEIKNDNVLIYLEINKTASGESHTTEIVKTSKWNLVKDISRWVKSYASEDQPKSPRQIIIEKLAIGCTISALFFSVVYSKFPNYFYGNLIFSFIIIMVFFLLSFNKSSIKKS